MMVYIRYLDYGLYLDQCIGAVLYRIDLVDYTSSNGTGSLSIIYDL